MYLNKATIIGNLTRDPELKQLPSGISVASISVATNRTWKGKDGARQEAVDYHNAVVFGKQAEVIAQYMKKGNQILIEGRIQTRSWEKDGVKNYRTEIVVDNFQFGARPSGEKTHVTRETSAPSTNEPLIEYPEEEINPDDIPF